MANLVETNNITLGRVISPYFTEEQIEIPAIGDGNCSVNAFALALINLIKKDALHLRAAQFKEFHDALVSNNSLFILKERLKLYRNQASEVEGNAYQDIADDLANIIRFLEANKNANGPVFIDFVKAQKTRTAIAALHVALAPALRALGVKYYKENLQARGVDDNGIIDDANQLVMDGVEAGEEILQPLARNFFGVNIQIINQKADKTFSLYNFDSNLEIPNAPSVSLLHVPGHWNYVLPASQKNGIVADLTQSPVSIVDSLIVRATELGAQKIINKNQIQAMASVVDSLNNSIAPTNLTLISEISTNLVSSLKDKIPNLADLTTVQYEKELLQHSPTQPAATSDEALARSLQNEEILKFLDSRFDTLKPKIDAYNTSVRPQIR